MIVRGHLAWQMATMDEVNDQEKERTKEIAKSSVKTSPASLVCTTRAAFVQGVSRTSIVTPTLTNARHTASYV